MNRRNGEIHVEIVTPGGQVIAHSFAIEPRIFYEQLGAVHVSDLPMTGGLSHAEGDKAIRAREEFINSMICPNIISAFNEHFKQHDTLNGYKIIQD